MELIEGVEFSPMRENQFGYGAPLIRSGLVRAYRTVENIARRYQSCDLLNLINPLA